MKPAIRVESLSKHYKLGERHKGYRTLRESLVDAACAPFRRFRGQRSDVRDQKGADFWALKDVSFEVQPGEVVGIIGRNGAGKSTLLKILSRITEPTSGQIELRGRVGSLLEVGTGFHPELTGRENIYMNGSILGMTHREIAKKFDEIVDFAGIEEFLDTPVKRYSSGMYVRLAFSVAAHLEPEILIVDEVLAVGDAEFQRKCLGKMHEVARHGRTVLFVSHNMAAVENLCSRALVLSAGERAFDGAPADAVSSYLWTTQDSCFATDLRTAARKHGLRPVLQRIDLLDAQGQPTNTITCGSEIIIDITFDQHERMRKLRFGIAFKDELGDALFLLQTGLQRGYCPDLVAGQISCRVRSLPLLPGRYYISIGCSSMTEQVDLVERACYVDVVEGDYFGTGRLPPTTHGRFLVDAEWFSPTVQQAL